MPDGYRYARAADARPGAVLFADGMFFDVVGRTGSGAITLLGDDGERRSVTVSVLIRKYVLARAATTLPDLPVLDERTDRLRRAGIDRILNLPVPVD